PTLRSRLCSEAAQAARIAVHSVSSPAKEEAMDRFIRRASRSSSLVVIWALLAFLPVTGAKADAVQSPAGKFVSRIANATMDISRRSGDGKSAGFRQLLARHGDVGPVGLFALGPYAKRLPPN